MAQADALGYDLKYAPCLLSMSGVLTGARRKPAWTDRVLHMSSPVANVRQLSYSMHPEITMSDHRPVSAVFKVDVRPGADSDLGHACQG